MCLKDFFGNVLPNVRENEFQLDLHMIFQLFVGRKNPPPVEYSNRGPVFVVTIVGVDLDDSWG